MKTMVINAGPRKNWNTAKLLHAAEEGAKEAGKETEFVELYNLVFTGCRSCMACKIKGISEPCKCYWKDMLFPVLEKVYKADTLIIGSPIYFGQPTGVFREFLERVCFPALSYNDYSSTFKGKIDVGVFLTMNVKEELYEKIYKEKLENEIGTAFRFLNGTVKLYPVFDTLQVTNYSKFDMASWNEESKREVHDTQFPKDLERAREIGKTGICIS